MNLLDLGLGQPLYLADYWDHNYSVYKSGVELTVSLNENLQYQKEGGLRRLKQSIIELHYYVGNANAAGTYVLIGHGATQLVGAAIANSPYPEIYSRKPDFFRFDQMIRTFGKTPIYMPRADGYFTELVTHPSNPENLYYPESAARHKIYDLCYNWPQYGTVIKQDKDIMIFGMAKATGHAGNRIGWALIRDRDMYNKMAQHVDITTGGVSYESQAMANMIISEQNSIFYSKHQSLYQAQTVFEFGKNVLENRWRRLLALNPPGLQFLNGSGMFAWVEIAGSANAAQELLARYQIQGMDGQTCGGSANQVRLNVGCDSKSFEELVQRLT